ncbi:ethylene-responsive transcription factor 5-like [Pyrus ussuriensis x Pyrus communis]|uniref:Ethylene-responsive transcription factor 5-like n=1 Tax=Pyrus ussuriensis x Pyrus communis TaxID=2448454 RepID=A0A5N5FS92_9ROSA|nr:ethylene-responsive transcription factor 5-like [Pyrus ussuriensis x Pyrus communis]
MRWIRIYRYISRSSPLRNISNDTALTCQWGPAKWHRSKRKMTMAVKTGGWLKSAREARVCLRSELGQMVVREVEDHFGNPEREHCSIVSIGYFNHHVEGPQPDLEASAVRIPDLRCVLVPRSLSAPRKCLFFSSF